MSDSIHIIGNTFMLLFVPFMILFPLGLALLVPNRAGEESRRLLVRGMSAALLAATVLALALWLGLTLAGTRFEWAKWAGNFSWMLFFPLWFGLAMPLLRAKNPAWEYFAHGAQGAHGSGGPLRTASLVNRARQNPVKGWMWAVAVFAGLAGLIAIGARGFFPFPTDGAGDDAVGGAERARWFVFLAVALCGPSQLVWLPGVLRTMLVAPEPMDAAGSQELADLYARQRRRRVLGMFWLMGVAMPLAIGGIFALIVWFPNLGGLWGLVGGLGGVLLGGIGAAFGFMMTAERAKIAEARARLDQSRAAAAG